MATAAFDEERSTSECDKDTDIDEKQKVLRSQDWDLLKQSYWDQLTIWPSRGKHILAHYDDDTIVVYQAFKPSIAEWAVEHQKFGGPEYKFTRMSWIKTNFLWMMFRCGWAHKHNQERVLAIRITRDGFEQILAKAFTRETRPDPAKRINNKVRLQWDPDHKPNGEHELRRAIQLGINKKLLEDFCTKFIVHIKDITDFAHEQHRVWTAKKDGIKSLITVRERVYMPSDPDLYIQLGLDTPLPQKVISLGN